MTFEKSIVCQLSFVKILGDEGRIENNVADSTKIITRGEVDKNILRIS